MLRRFLIAGISIISCVSAYAQDSTAPSGPTITGAVDVFYRYNFSDPVPVPPSGNNGSITNVNNFTSFTNAHKSYELGMASVKVDHSIGKAAVTIDLGFGRRAEEFSYADGNHSTLFAVKQAYLSYAVTSKLKLTMGKWATHIGYELVDAYLNRNYSMSYMFSYGPFSHTGLKADIGLGGKSNLMIGVANNTDVVSTTSARKYALAQFSTGSSDDKFKAYLNYQGSYGGSLDLTQFDVVLTAAIADKFSLGYNGTVQSRAYNSSDGNSWWGSALYVNADPTDKFGITLRGEYFSDKKDVLGFETSIFDLTLSPNIKLGNLIVIPEIRFETAKDEIYVKNDGSSSKSTVSAILAAVYHF